MPQLFGVTPLLFTWAISMSSIAGLLTLEVSVARMWVYTAATGVSEVRKRITEHLGVMYLFQACRSRDMFRVRVRVGYCTSGRVSLYCVFEANLFGVNKPCCHKLTSRSRCI